MDVVTYPIAERFHSIQGEGEHAGRPMHFVRLAGCNVGKPQSSVQPPATQALSIYPNHTICTNMFGEQFLCDTDYTKAETIAVQAIIADTYERYICITGGEPFLYDLFPIIDAAADAGIAVHIETSGTKLIPEAFVWRGKWRSNLWITCSPKAGFLAENLQRGTRAIDELKFTVSDAADPTEVIRQVDAVLALCAEGGYHLVPPSVWLQPINGVNELYRSSALLAMEVLRVRPEWRLCVQVHKAIGVR